MHHCFGWRFLWKEVLQVIDEIRREAVNMGAIYVIILHPAQLQIEKELLQELKQKYQLTLNDYNLELPQKFLLDQCQSKGMTCLDLLPVFKEKWDSEALYLLRDSHYNNAGNRLAAETIFDFLVNQLEIFKKQL